MELVHTDVWRPVRVPSLGGSHYFVINFLNINIIYLICLESENLWLRTKQF